jgi:hypothetical protein
MALLGPDLIERVLEFANSGDLYAWAQFLQRVSPVEFSLYGAGGTFAGNRRWAESQQQLFREALTAIAADERRAASLDRVAEWQTRFLAGLPNLASDPLAHDDLLGGESLNTDRHNGTPRLSSALAYALLEVSLGRLSGLLCKCRLPGCGRFFFATRPRKGMRGRSITRYCPGGNCAELSHQAGNAERVSRHRNLRRAARLTGRALGGTLKSRIDLLRWVRAGDFDSRAKTLKMSGRRKAPRVVSLDTEAAEFFTQLTAGKPAVEQLFSRRQPER